jgi:hypothetical protein
MNQNTRSFSFLVLALAVLGGCSSEPKASDAKKKETPLLRVQGKVRTVPDMSGSGDGSLNAGGPALNLWKGKRLYRLFSRRGLELVDDTEYVVEGVLAQKVIEEIGDPANGKQGYPLLSSCQRVVKMAWGGISFEEVDLKAAVLRARVGRYPARNVLLIVKIQPVPKDGGKKSAATGDAAEDDESIPVVAVAADKQSASLVEGSLVQQAPLWDPAGTTASCKVIIDTKGKIAELETGAQLCEAFDWDKLRYQPLVKAGKPVRVKTEVALRFDPRK